MHVGHIKKWSEVELAHDGASQEDLANVNVIKKRPMLITFRVKTENHYDRNDFRSNCNKSKNERTIPKIAIVEAQTSNTSTPPTRIGEFNFLSTHINTEL